MNSFVIPHDKIIFCDDDDIMLKIPPVYEYDVISGYQYITGFFEDDKNDFNDYEKIIELTKSPNILFWRKVNDFSGYACNYKLFKEFFELNTFNFTDESILNKYLLQMIDLEFMKYLESKGFDINSTNRNGDNSYLTAVLYDLNTVKYLEEKGADIHCVNVNFQNAFMMACFSGNLSIGC
jgi:hypothetical protein